MDFKNIIIILFLVVITFSFTQTIKAEEFRASILFDAGHAEDAGNADWLIQGGYSDFADLLKAHNYEVTDITKSLTLEILENHDVLVISEPNSAFTKEEQKTIIQFITDGGGVFFIGNHIESDRNHSGIDSIGVFNQFVEELGFRFEDADFLEANLSAEPVSGEYKEHPATYKVNEMAIWSGTSMEIHDPDRVQGLIFFNEWRYSQPALIAGTHNKGHFVAVGDSAIFDDGTGTIPHENLHKGFIEYDHKQLALNVINWLTQHPVEDL
ncbi:MAG: Gldg family protein [Halanaerobiales bacterium]|nr:Gldg family protein [Halanaerobiales bacterium]